MKKIFFTLTLIVSASFSMIGQNQSQQLFDNQLKSKDGKSAKDSGDKTAGSKYFTETFSPAKIGNDTKIYLIRHNAYTDEIEIKTDNDAIAILPAETNQVVTLMNNKTAYEYVAYTTEKGEKKQGYLACISNSPKLKIFKKETVILKPESHPASGYDTYKPATYTKTRPEYYIQANNEEIKFFEAKKKNVLSLVPNKEKEVSQFIKDNKISLSEDNDLNQLGTYLNSIL